MDEKRLMAGYKRGESWARREIYETFAPAMMSLCVRYVQNTDVAKDLLQDGFVKVFTHAEQFSGKGALGGWIRQIMVNTALEYLRRQNALKWQDLDENIVEVEKNNLSENLNNITAEELMECITQLPDVYRTVFNLVCVEGYSYAEIAQQMKTSENIIRMQYFRAREKLKKIIFT